MKFYLVAILLGLVVSGYTQKCNLEKNEIDGITELTVKKTKPLMLLRISGQPLYVKAQSIGDNKYLKILFYKYNDYSFLEDREIGFILSDNQEVTLFPREMPTDTTRLENYSLLIYKLNNDQYTQLTTLPIIKFKYFIVAGFIQEDIKKSRQSVVSSLLKCVE